MALDNNDLLVWIDMETTGLDAQREVPLELGIMLTDLEGETLESWCSLVIPENWAAKLTAADPVVQAMHIDSGLVFDIKRATLLQDVGRHHPAVVDGSAVGWLSDHGVEPGVHPLVGSTINFDRAFMEQHFPLLFKFFHYRNIDISTLKGLCSRLNPKVFAALDSTKGTHRVYTDLPASVAEYRFYKDNFLHVALPVSS